MLCYLKYKDAKEYTVRIEIGWDEVHTLSISDIEQEKEFLTEILITKETKEMKILLSALKSEFFNRLAVDEIIIKAADNNYVSFLEYAPDSYYSGNPETSITILKDGIDGTNFNRFCEEALEILGAL